MCFDVFTFFLFSTMLKHHLVDMLPVVFLKLFQSTLNFWDVLDLLSMWCLILCIMGVIIISRKYGESSFFQPLKGRNRTVNNIELNSILAFITVVMHHSLQNSFPKRLSRSNWIRCVISRRWMHVTRQRKRSIIFRKNWFQVWGVHDRPFSKTTFLNLHDPLESSV